MSTITCWSASTAPARSNSLQVYDFLCDAGVEFIQFIPVVERLADETAARDGLKLHAPGDIQGELTEWSGAPR